MQFSSFKSAFLFSALAFSVPATSFAKSIVCSNASGSALYSFFSLDNRSNRENEVSWTLDGQRHIEETTMEIVAPGGGGFSRPGREVTSTLENQVALEQTSIPQRPVRIFTADATVTSFKTQEILFQGNVICEESLLVDFPQPL